jgi:hypothetical protein
METRDIGRTIEMLAGVGLVVLGGLFALAEFAGDRGWALVWPLFIVVPGLLFYAAMIAFSPRAGFLAIPGSILVVAGLCLLVTNTLGNWAAWSYLWALVTPGAVGLGLWLFGVQARVPGLRRTGGWLLFAGVVVFAVLAAVFELALGMSGPAGVTIGRALAPALLVALGVVLVVFSLRRRPAG